MPRDTEGVVGRASDDQVMPRATAGMRGLAAEAGAGRGRSSLIRKRRGRSARGKAPRVDGARCALRMRRGDATVSVRQDTRFVDVKQTRVANARCRVPRRGSRPSEGGKYHHNSD